jgi:hypothetical protein
MQMQCGWALRKLASKDSQDSPGDGQAQALRAGKGDFSAPNDVLITNLSGIALLNA